MDVMIMKEGTGYCADAAWQNANSTRETQRVYLGKRSTLQLTSSLSHMGRWFKQNQIINLGKLRVRSVELVLLN